jgi:outer membrane protein OmpA-like peptidoglycan-associated protein
MQAYLDGIVTAFVAVAVAGLPLTGLTQNPSSTHVAQSVRVGGQNGWRSDIGETPTAPLPTQSGGAAGLQIPNCEQLVEQFNEAVDTGSEESAQQLVDSIATTAMCSAYQVAAQRRLSAFRLATVNALMARDVPLERYERLLISADRPDVLWQAAATLAEVRFGQKRFADAALGFDRAIEIIKNERLTPLAPSRSDIENLFERAAQVRLLLAHSTANDRRAGFVETSRNSGDMLGGIYSPSVRSIIVHSIIVPITFEYRTTTFTSAGEAAARELLAAMKQQQPQRATLVGHTDIRGSAEFNIKLSRDRADAVAHFLKTNGVVTSFETIGRGATEPLNLPNGFGLSQDEIYALNRRVEWLRE